MKTVTVIVALVVISTLIFWKNIEGIKNSTGKEEQQLSQTDQHQAMDNGSAIQIHHKWEMPASLKEISDIVYLDKDRIACVQDETGAIFIYNRTGNKVEKEIPFAGPGDYEGIALNGDKFYIVRSDGVIFELDREGGAKSAQSYTTSLTAVNNIEGLCYDKTGDRLLLAVKDKDPGNSGYKGIYAFDLKKKTLLPDPVYKIDMNDEMLASGSGKKKKSFNPSSLAIHPVSNEFYITDGTRSKLMILDRSGKIRSVMDLGKQFSQPEGITFSPDGAMFISNEGRKEPGNIMSVEIVH